MPVLAVLGAHWGDEGKGRVAAALSRDATACARFQGGPNAGHTVAFDGGELVLRMIPSGVVSGATGVVGGGCVIEPSMLLEEIAMLRRVIPDVVSRLLVSRRAHVITPAHREADRSGSGVGSTRTGVGPTYRDKAARTGLRVADLIEKGKSLPVDLREVAEMFRDTLSGVCGDETAYLRGILDSGGNVVAEGAQGARLDLDHGDYPYVTSSNTTIGSVLTGLGLGTRDISSVLLVSPAYVTKVGGGPLPSLLTDDLNAELQRRGRELDGATQLMRQTGWLDIGWLRRACYLNQADGIVLTKVDVLAGVGAVGLYDEANEPPVTMVPGWTVSEVASADETGALGSFIRYVESRVSCRVLAVSRGPGMDDWWWRTSPASLW